MEPAPPAPPAPSWAEVVGDANRRVTSPLPIDSEVLEKLKNLVTDTVRVDDDSRHRARQRFQNALYGKLFGRSPPFETIKASLLGLWQQFGNIQISDMPNGFLLIRCETEEVKEQLLFGGPWAVQGIVLQLAPWQPGFEPAFMTLKKAMIWVQLHNFPVDYWDGDSFETHTASIGRLVKIDEPTASLSRTRFARACFEIDLSVPLKRGFWLEDDGRRTFVFVLYERTPILCYSCGLVGHGVTSCPNRSESIMSPPAIGHDAVADGRNTLGLGHPGGSGVAPNDYGPSMETMATANQGWRWTQAPRRRRGRGRGQSTGDGFASREEHVPLEPSRRSQQARVPAAQHVEGTSRQLATSERFDPATHRDDPRGCQPSGFGDVQHVAVGEQSRGISGRGGRGGRGGLPHSASRCASSIARPVVPGVVPGPQPTGVIFREDGQTGGSGSKEQDCGDGSTRMEVDRKGKAKQQSSEPTPLLLTSASVHRADCSSDAHRLFVQRVEQALVASKHPSEAQSDSDNSDVDLILDDFADERSLWEFQKSMQKRSRDRKGLQVLSAVQKKKIQKKKGSGKAGGMHSLSVNDADA